jgi:hypothetical protein
MIMWLFIAVVAVAIVLWILANLTNIF